MKNKSTRGAATRQKILEAAAELINRKGFNGTSVDDILEASGTGKSQFYHHFASKTQLARELVDFHAPLMPLACLTTINTCSNLEEFETALTSLLESHRNGQFQFGCPTSNLATELVAGSEELAMNFRTIFSGLEVRLTEIIGMMRYRGHLRQELVPTEVANFIMSSIEGALLLAKIVGTSEPLAATVSQLRYYLRSLSNRAPAPTRQLNSPRPVPLAYCP